MVTGNPTGFVNVISGEASFTQTALSPLMEAVNDGSTVIVKSEEGPGHPFAVGVMVILELMGPFVELLVVKSGIGCVVALT